MTKSHAFIAVVDPAVRTAELDCFNLLSVLSPLPLTYHLPALFGGASMQTERKVLAGVIVLGSGSSVHDNLPWQKELGKWLSQKIEAGVPTLGICFGHQFIVHCFGGKVDFLFSDKRKVQGFRELYLDKTRLWGPETEDELFVSHRETVVTKPDGFRVIAQSTETSIEGLEHENLPVWTLQPHPEATPAFLTNVDFKSQVDESRFNFGHSLVAKFLEFAANRAKDGA